MLFFDHTAAGKRRTQHGPLLLAALAGVVQAPPNIPKTRSPHPHPALRLPSLRSEWSALRGEQELECMFGSNGICFNSW